MNLASTSCVLKRKKKTKNKANEATKKSKKMKERWAAKKDCTGCTVSVQVIQPQLQMYNKL